MLKDIYELALQAGREYQSPQTGFIHYCYQRPVPSVHHSIPIYENFLFVLALFRSRLTENIQEAKELLFRLLSYQSPAGHFPFYLHEYPKDQEAQNGVRLIPPLFYLLKDFGHVLGKELKIGLEGALDRLVQFLWKEHEKAPFPYSLSILLSASRQALGKEVSKWEEKLSMQDSWHATSYLADLLVAGQMLGDGKAWDRFYEFVNLTWHRELGSYVGPCIKEWQERDEPQPCLYDLFLGYFSGILSKRAQALKIYHLQGCLIVSRMPHWPSASYPLHVKGSYRHFKWMLQAQENWSWSAIEKKESLSPITEKTFTPFRLLAGSLDKLHSFVCQGGKADEVRVLERDEGVEITFFMEGENGQEREKTRDICFYLDDHPDWIVRVDGHPSTIFEVGQIITFDLKGLLTVRLHFDVIGEGEFMGHLAKGNRPAQARVLGEEKFFESYDKILFLRTVRRSSPCQVKATLQVL